MTLFSFHSLRRLRHLRVFAGFTQIEILVIVFIIGLMAAIATPSFAGMLETANMKKATVEVRTALQETQRQSIRKNQACQAQVLISGQSDQGSRVEGNCLTTGDRQLPHGIGMTTNVLPDPTFSGDLGDSSSNFYASLNVHRAAAGGLPCRSKTNPKCQTNPEPSTPGSTPSSSSPQNSRDASNDSKRSSSSRVNKKINMGFSPLGAANFAIATPLDNLGIESQNAKFISFRPNKIEGKKTCMVVSRSLGLTRIGSYEGSLDPIEITTSGKCQVASWAEQ